MKLIAILFLVLMVVPRPKKNDILVKNDVFEIHYSEILEQPTSVKYSVDCDETIFSRKGLDFYRCDSIYTSDNNDYENNEWDKGHMAPAADFACNRDKLAKTFSYLNCALQHMGLNRGVWKELEVLERKISKEGKVNVTILVHFSDKSKKLPTGATIPDGFTKILEYGKRKETYYFPNEEPKFKKLKQYRVK